MKRAAMLYPTFLLTFAVLGHDAAAQGVTTLVRQADDGFVRMTFAARPGLCRDGKRYSGDNRSPHWQGDDGCDDGPVHLLLNKTAGDITRVRAYVGGRWRPLTDNTTDLGRVSAPDAARFLLELARTSAEGHRAIMPATLADSIAVWPSLLEIARDPALNDRTKREALQWLGMLAGERLARDESADPEQEWRRQAVFALSQLPKDEGIPRLIDVARSHRFEYMKRLALFWLGQSGDSRALPVMEAAFRNP